MMICEPLIKQIRYFSLEKERAAISFAMFLSLVIDACIIPILVRSNFDEYGKDSFIVYFFNNGRYSDFGAECYPILGKQLYFTLILLSIRPILEMLGEASLIKIKRSIKNHSYRFHRNNDTDPLKYLELYAGPEYKFHKKMASLNAVLFITIVFGMAFPIFYAICFFAFAVKYFVERHTIAKFYRVPK
jgi:hypothetical protein